MDTNVLVYLIDKTYPSLNTFVELLSESAFSDLVSSRFVILEFAAARKREHYLRFAVKPKTTGAEMNLSSLLKYRDRYDDPGVVFDDAIVEIKRTVTAEVNRIATEFGIDFEYGSFHADQLTATQDICLTSKLADHDCLVLVSSVLPEPKTTHPNVIILTNDADFVRFYEAAQLDALLATHEMFPPQLFRLTSVGMAGASAVNLQITSDKVTLENQLNGFLYAFLKQKLPALFLGITFEPKGAGFPADCVSFEAIPNCKLPEEVYVAVISKGLDFVYATKKRVRAFWHNGKPITNGYEPPRNQANYISFRVSDVDELGNEQPVDKTIIDALRVHGNLVFIHPDSANQAP